MTWRQLTDTAGGWAHWANLDAANQWLAAAVALSSEQRESELAGQRFDVQLAGVAAAWDALWRALASLNIQPITSPTVQCWFSQWGVMVYDPDAGFGRGPGPGVVGGFVGSVWRPRIARVLERAKPDLWQRGVGPDTRNERTGRPVARNLEDEIGEVWLPYSLNPWGRGSPSWPATVGALAWTQCQGALAGMDACDFNPRLGAYNGCTDASAPGPGNSCPPWTWDTLAWHDPPSGTAFNPQPVFAQVLVPLRWCLQSARALAMACQAMGGANLVAEAITFALFNNIIGADNYATDPYQFLVSNVGAFASAIQAGAAPVRQAAAVVRAVGQLAAVVPGWGTLAAAVGGIVATGIDALGFSPAATWPESEFGEVLAAPPSPPGYTGAPRKPMAYRRAELVLRDGNLAPYFDSATAPPEGPANGAVDTSTVTGDQAYAQGLAAALYGPCATPAMMGRPPVRGGDMAQLLARQGPAALVGLVDGVPVSSGAPAPSSASAPARKGVTRLQGLEARALQTRLRLPAATLGGAGIPAQPTPTVGTNTPGIPAAPAATLGDSTIVQGGAVAAPTAVTVGSGSSWELWALGALAVGAVLWIGGKRSGL